MHHLAGGVCCRLRRRCCNRLQIAPSLAFEHDLPGGLFSLGLPMALDAARRRQPQVPELAGKQNLLDAAYAAPGVAASSVCAVAFGLVGQAWAKEVGSDVSAGGSDVSAGVWATVMVGARMAPE